MSLILAWVLFPVILGALGIGWGTLLERCSGGGVADALFLPLGLAAALVVAGTLTAFSGTAPAAVPAVSVGAVAGLGLWRGRRWPGRWPLVAALGALLAFGAPVLLSGQATFAGFVKLDDTATWFNVIDHVFSHGRSVAGSPPSTYNLVYTGDIGASYPLGAFMLPGVARALAGVDIAWVFQPYLACCAAALAMCLYELVRPLVASPRLCALTAFLAAQPALLYGYSLWGGIKELTAAFLLALGGALLAAAVRERPRRPRGFVPLAVAAAALIQTLGVGAGGWVAPAFVLLILAWLVGARRSGELRRRVLSSVGWLGAITALFVVPVWIVLGDFLSNDAGLFSSGESDATRLGNLIRPLNAFQLAGVWPTGDFRQAAPGLPTALLVAAVLLAALAALWLSLRRRQLDLALYVAIALVGCGGIYLVGATPWVVGKTLAISSPALLTAALAGAAVLAARHRLGIVVLALLAGGVLWSNALAYRDVVLAPRSRLVELQHVAGLVAGKGPVLINEYEVYADRHFLRDGAPVEPAEYRSASIPLRSGALLTKSAQADLDSFPLSTLASYRSLVVRRSPAESRPPAEYTLVWEGRYYELWQRPQRPSTTVYEHIPLGESNLLPYCGVAENGAIRSQCSLNPVATPPCSRIESIARQATRLHAELLAFQRPAPIVARGDQTLWPAAWLHDPAGHTLTPTAPGTAIAHIAVAVAERYELWLGGSFGRGFRVSVDGQAVGSVKDQLSAFDAYVPVASLELSPGVHTFALTFPHADLTPGSGEKLFTSLSAIALEPQSPRRELIATSPANPRVLCHRPLDWIEIARVA